MLMFETLAGQNGAADASAYLISIHYMRTLFLNLESLGLCLLSHVDEIFLLSLGLQASYFPGRKYTSF